MDVLKELGTKLPMVADRFSQWQKMVLKNLLGPKGFFPIDRKTNIEDGSEWLTGQFL